MFKTILLTIIMMDAILPMAIFTLLILRVPFTVFLNISIDKMFLEYKILPFNIRGYVYLEHMALKTGTRKKEKQNGLKIKIKQIMESINVKSLHFRSIISSNSLQVSIFQSVIYDFVTDIVLEYILKKNPDATVSARKFIDSEEDNNIFIETKVALSGFGVLKFLALDQLSKLRKKGDKNGRKEDKSDR